MGLHFVSRFRHIRIRRHSQRRILRIAVGTQTNPRLFRRYAREVQQVFYGLDLHRQITIVFLHQLIRSQDL